MSDLTLGERLAEKIVRMTGQHYFGSLIGGMSGLASLIDTDEGVKRLAALEREADNRDEMEAMIAQRYCEHIKLLDTKVERLVADKERAEAFVNTVASIQEEVFTQALEEPTLRALITTAVDLAAALAPADKTEEKRGE